MTRMHTYSYVLLRYRHDPIGEEFVNVGVVLHSPEAGYLDIRIRSALARVTNMFPQADRSGLRDALQHVARSIRDQASAQDSDLLSRNRDITAIVQRILPEDDSALRWSLPGGGITPDPAKELDYLSERFITVYDPKVDSRRSDNDVWRAFRDRLARRNLDTRLQEKIIRSDADELDFKFAWKNGQWHCVQPLSFDLTDGDGIRDKARRWGGHLMAVADSVEQFTPYFVLAPPTQPHLQNDYAHAISILMKCAVALKIYGEGEIETFIELIAHQVAAHGARVDQSLGEADDPS